VNRPSHSANDRSAHYGPARADLLENRDELTHVSNAVFEQASTRSASTNFLNPILEAAAMALSRVTVLANALRLRRVRVG
jgi:hypothetical protein